MSIKLVAKILAISSAAILALGLSACAQKPASVVDDTPAPFQHLSLARYQSLATKLRARGVVVVKQQGSVGITIKSRTLFYNNRLQIRKDQADTLDMIVTLVRHAPGASIRVIGYSDYLPTVKGQYALSHKMAAKVAAALWRRGVPTTQKMRIEAKANTRPVSGSLTARGNAQNQRVEIRIN